MAISTQTARDIAAMIEPRFPQYADEIVALAEERDIFAARVALAQLNILLNKSANEMAA